MTDFVLSKDQQIETVEITDRTPIEWTKKVNPVWWLQGPDGWNVPDVNNGEPYLPGIENVWLRRLIWFGLRNPLMNFVGFVVGVEDQNYTVKGTYPVLRTTGRDCDPVQHGWRWAIITCGWRRLPFVSFYDGKVEFYWGWRPASGGQGTKLVFPKQPPVPPRSDSEQGSG